MVVADGVASLTDDCEVVDIVVCVNEVGFVCDDDVAVWSLSGMMMLLGMLFVMLTILKC